MFRSRASRPVASVALLFVIVTFALPAFGGAHDSYRIPTYHTNPALNMPTFTLPSIPSTPTYQPRYTRPAIPTYRAPTATPQQPSVDWRDFTRDFAMPEPFKRDMHRNQRNSERDYWAGCAQYNRYCANMLNSLGQ